MGFRIVVMITLYARQEKKNRYIEQSFVLWKNTRVGWFARISHENSMYIIICETDSQSRFHA